MLAVWMTALLAAQAPAAEPACRVAVLNLTGRGLPAQDADVPLLVTEVITNEVATASGCDVISPADIRSMVDFDAARQECDVTSASCLSEIGPALGVEYLVAGTLGRLGSDYVISLRLVELATTRVEARAEEVVTGQAEKLRGAAKQVARSLFPRGRPGQKPAAAVAGPAIDPLVVVSGGATALGLLAAGVGTFFVVDAETRLGNPEDTDKGGALMRGRGGVITLLAGLGVAVAGVTGVVLSLVDSEESPASPAVQPTTAASSSPSSSSSSSSSSTP
jgi:hypothetical protein